MKEPDSTKIFWSARATALILELDGDDRAKVEYCIELIGRFPLIGVRLLLSPEGHQRRFICGGFQIVYDLDTHKTESTVEPTESQTRDYTDLTEITVRFFNRV